jgi:hypothetical protein
MTQVESFCRRHVPEKYRDEVRLEATVRGNSVTVGEASGTTPAFTNRPPIFRRTGRDAVVSMPTRSTMRITLRAAVYGSAIHRDGVVTASLPPTAPAR